jgi:hypothetical protein
MQWGRVNHENSNVIKIIGHHRGEPAGSSASRSDRRDCRRSLGFR